MTEDTSEPMPAAPASECPQKTEEPSAEEYVAAAMMLIFFGILFLLLHSMIVAIWSQPR